MILKTKLSELAATLQGFIHPTVTTVTHTLTHSRTHTEKTAEVYVSGKPVSMTTVNRPISKAYTQMKHYLDRAKEATQSDTRTLAGQERWQSHSEHLNPSTMCIRMKSGKSSQYVIYVWFYSNFIKICSCISAELLGSSSLSNGM